MNSPHKSSDISANAGNAALDLPGLHEAVARKMRLWKERLIDLSLRNRLLNFKETAASTLKVLQPEPRAIFDHLVKAEREYFIPIQEEQIHGPGPSDDPLEREAYLGFLRDSGQEANYPAIKTDDLMCEGTPTHIERVLYNLRSRAHTELEERGTNVLFVALGFLSFPESSSSSSRLLAPVVLIPVQLERERTRHRYRLSRVPEDIVINPALALKLKNDFGIALPELPDSSESVDLGALLPEIRERLPRTASWEIREECQIGLFSFLKFMMYKDLEASKDTAPKHRVVAALCGFLKALPEVPSDLPTAEKLDDALKPDRTYQILDADSSQQEAIAAALGGVTFVLQGPPGTGKSQTIANIISECLVADKKVLFVSEKMAALEVVKRRLDQCGIGQFCLELHSHKTNKKNVLQELSEQLTHSKAYVTEEEGFPFAKLEERRRQLNAFVKAMHERRCALNVTLFSVNARLSELWAAPNIATPITEPDKKTAEWLDKAVQQFNRLASNEAMIRQYQSHPWKHTLLADWSLQQQVQIEQGLSVALADVDAAASSMSRLYALIGAHLTWIEDLLLSRYTDEVLQLDLDHLLQRFAGPWRGLGKYLHYRAYKNGIRMVRRCALQTSWVRAGRVATDLELARLVRDARGLLAHFAMSRPQESSGTLNAALSTFPRISIWAQDSLSFSDSDYPGSPLLSAAAESANLSELKAVLSEATEISTKLQSVLEYLSSLFRLDTVGINQDCSVSFLRGWVQARLETLSQLRTWLDTENTLGELRNQGLGRFADKAIASGTGAKDVPAAFEKQFYLGLMAEMCRADPALASFHSTYHERTISEFRNLDARLVHAAPHRIAARLASRLPSAGHMAPAPDAVKILQREI